MTPDQLKCIQLRDCFYAGYSMPQYCVDRNIKNPLIASYDPEFLWEIYVQFCYAKGIFPKLCILSGGSITVGHGVFGVVGGIRLEHVDFNDIDFHDCIIMLTTNRFSQLPPERTVYFDTLLLQFTTYVYAERPLYHWVNAHKGVKVIVTDFPVLKNNVFMTEYEKEVLKQNIHQLREELKGRNGNVIENRFDLFGYSNDEAYSMLEMSGARTNSDGTTELIDNDNPLVMIENGKRRTAYQDGEYENTIFCMGTCVFYGICAPYDKTIESYLQKMINENGHTPVYNFLIFEK